MVQIATRILCYVGTAMALTATSDDADTVWMIHRNEAGLELTYAVPETDISVFTFGCRRGAVELTYSLDADRTLAYGTIKMTKIDLKIGKVIRKLFATASFDESGSPAVAAKIIDAKALLHDLMLGKKIETHDQWTTLIAPVPSKALIANFAKQCSTEFR